MREAHPLAKRVAETLDLGDESDLFAQEESESSLPGSIASRRTMATGEAGKNEELTFGDALLGLLGSTTSGIAG